MEFIKRTSTLYFVAAIMFFIAAIIEKNSMFTIFGCANTVFGIKYKKKK